MLSPQNEKATIASLLHQAFLLSNWIIYLCHWGCHNPPLFIYWCHWGCHNPHFIYLGGVGIPIHRVFFQWIQWILTGALRSRTSGSWLIFITPTLNYLVREIEPYTESLRNGIIDRCGYNEPNCIIFWYILKKPSSGEKQNDNT